MADPYADLIAEQAGGGDPYADLLAEQAQEGAPSEEEMGRQMWEAEKRRQRAERTLRRKLLASVERRWDEPAAIETDPDVAEAYREARRMGALGEESPTLEEIEAESDLKPAGRRWYDVIGKGGDVLSKYDREALSKYDREALVVAQEQADRVAFTEAIRGAGQTPEEATEEAMAWASAHAAAKHQPSFLENLGSLAASAATFALPSSGRAPTGLSQLVDPSGDVEAPAPAFRQNWVPPGGRTVRKPTVLGTGLELLETPQRVILSPWTKRGDESVMTSAGLSLIPPSWAQGGKPRDAVTLYRDWVVGNNGNPNDFHHLLGSFAFAVGTDPAVGVGIGAKFATRTATALKQVTRIGRRGLRAQGLRGADLDDMTRAFSDEVAAVMVGDELRFTRDAVEEATARLVSPEAALDVRNLGVGYGEVGLRVGLPFMEGKEIVSAKRMADLGVAGGGAGAVMGAATGAAVGGPIGGALGGVAGAAAGALTEKGVRGMSKSTGPLRQLTRLFDPVAADMMHTDDDLIRFWEHQYRLTHTTEHQHRVVSERVSRMRSQFDNVSSVDEYEDLIKAMPAELDAMLIAGDPLTETSDFATMVLNMSRRMARNRHKAGDLVVDPQIIGGKVDDFLANNAVRDAYSETTIRLAADDIHPDDAEALFTSYGAKALENIGVEADLAQTQMSNLWAKNKDWLPVDQDIYRSVRQQLPRRLDALLEYHDAELAPFRRIEEEFTERFARQAENDAQGMVEHIAERGGGQATPDQILAARKEARETVQAKLATDRSDYFHTFLLNPSGIHRRGGAGQVGQPGPGKFAKHKVHLDIIDNWEQGTNPATDLMQSLAARLYASIRMKAKADFLHMATSDRRWAVPLHEAKGLDAKSGWGPWTHQWSGQKYAVRNEVADMLDEAAKFHDPGWLEKLAKYTIDPFHDRWKGFATHARMPFYNARNFVDDRFRMSMGGYTFSPTTAKKATTISFLGNLETSGTHKRLQRMARKPATSDAGKFAERNKDALQDRFHQGLEEFGSGGADGQFMIKGGPDGSRTVTPQEFYNASVEHGIVDKGHAGADLPGSIPRGAEEGWQWAPRLQKWQKVVPFHRQNPVFGPDGFLMRSTSATAKMLENQRRMALFLNRFEKGDSFAEAASAVNKWAFDYKRMTPFERQVVRRGIPFWAFSRNSIPRTFEAMARHPGRYTTLHKGKRVIEERAEHANGPVAAVRQYMDDLFAVRTIDTSPGGAAIFWNPGLSWTDINVLGAAVPGMTATGSDEVWDRFTPAIDIMKIIFGWRDPRSGRSLKAQWAEPDASLKMLLKIHDATAPKGMKVMREQITPTGHRFDVAPRGLVLLWRNMAPHMVAYGRLFKSDRGDPFEDDASQLRFLKELTGQSQMVNNPLKAEAERAEALSRDNLAGVRVSDEGPVIVPTE